MTLDRKIKWFAILLVAANLVIVLMVVLGAFNNEPPQKPLPNPNGYDDFVKAGKLWINSGVYWPKMTEDELRSNILANEPTLKLLRAGLSRECRVPDDYSQDYMLKFVSETTPIRYAGQVLCAEGRLAELEKRYKDAAQHYLEDIELGEHWTRGGFMVCKLIGNGSEYDGRRGLEMLREKLDAQNCRMVCNSLEIIDKKEEPIENVLQQEKLFMRKFVPLPARIGELIPSTPAAKEKKDFIQSFQTNQFLRRQMMLDFAARAYELEKGKPPKTVADLVPEYLRTIPKDPVTGSNLTIKANSF